ncbi:MAG: sulfide/dihydroorotate dehydrogenase-like FAD/NAD-binding protein [Eggerthellaceae bacterium]|nr:sulfide/dihydroorotate dehydrogenase-like FAD/NAD-binding protein [Eggerthellaceae bacterium]
MFEIVKAERLTRETTRMEFFAPAIAHKALPGQFVMLRVDDRGERIPLTICDKNEREGTIILVFQAVGATTVQLSHMEEGQKLEDLVGPLGMPTDFGSAKRVCILGGGLGSAIAYPQAKWLHNHGVRVDVILGFRSHDLVIMEDAFKRHCDSLVITTDDGSYGEQGFVTDVMMRQIEEGAHYDLVIAVGPVPMMKVASELTRPLGIRTIVSMNTLMIDGTGVCGCCRVRVGDEYKHACVDGPDFDGHLVDFDEAMRRNDQFSRSEHEALVRLAMEKRL